MNLPQHCKTLTDIHVKIVYSKDQIGLRAVLCVIAGLLPIGNISLHQALKILSQPGTE